MTTPAVTTILDEVGARLTNITTGNGYYYSVQKVVRSRIEPFLGYDLPAINYWCMNLANERNVYNDDNRTLELLVEIFALTRDDPFIDIVSKLASDVITGLTRTTAAPEVSDTPDYDLGETVTELVFNGYDYLIGQGQEPWCGALVKFSIKYQTDPFEMTSYGA